MCVSVCLMCVCCVCVTIYSEIFDHIVHLYVTKTIVIRFVWYSLRLL